MPTESYLDGVQREFRRLQLLSDRALVQLDDREYFQVSGEEDNSVAVIVKHLAGNMLSRWNNFLGSDGDSGRDRDAEFVVSASETRESIQEAWTQGWECLFGAIADLEDSDLDRTVVIRGERHSVLQAINRQIVHYAYHVGQLVFLAKHLTGARWKSLSIPRGQSDDFSQTPGSYLSDPVKKGSVDRNS